MGDTLEFSPKALPIHSLEKQKPTYTKKFCQHNSLVVSERRGMVECKLCGDDLSPLEALKILCNRIWWEENTRERQLEYDAKRVSKVQAAAFLCLFEAGITPEKFAERWKKEDEKRKTVAIEVKKEPAAISGTSGNGAA